MASEGLPRSRRLRSAKDFANMRAEGRAVHTRDLKVVVRPSTRSRLGLVVSKRVSKRAVDRNQVKRHLRESFRRNPHLFPPHTDILLIAKPSALGVPGDTLCRQLARAEHAMARAANALVAQGVEAC